MNEINLILDFWFPTQVISLSQISVTMLFTLPPLALLISEVFLRNRKLTFHAVNPRIPVKVCPVAKVSILKSIFMGSSRGCPGNAGFGFVIRKHTEEPSSAAIGNIG